MAEKKYLNLEGLQDVANHVNTRLKTVTTIPASADDGAVRLYVGETGVTYKKGHIYQYNATDLEWVDITSSSEYTAGNGIDITDDEISVETYIFTGTQAEWDALTTDEKKEYDICNITDDASSDDEIYTKSEIDALLDDKVSYEDNGVLGAKNLLELFDNDIKNNLSGASHTYSNGELTVNCTSTEFSGALILQNNLRAKFANLINVPCILTFEYKSSVSCSANIGIPSAPVTVPTTWTVYTKEILDPSTIAEIQFYNRDTTQAPVISARNFMLRLASDTDNTYQPYSMTNQQMTPYVQSISNPNLLDNPWFTVNQRGFTTSTLDGKYFVDRWTFVPTDENVTASLTANGININGTTSGEENLVCQRIEYDKLLFKVGEDYTLSVMFGDGTIVSHTDKIKAFASTWSYHIKFDVDNIRFMFCSNGDLPTSVGVWIKALDAITINKTIRAIKLEKGTVSTLAMDTVPNMATELLKCQRYFYRLAPLATDKYGIIAMGTILNQTTIRASIPLFVQMRAKPTVTFNLDTDKIKFGIGSASSLLPITGMVIDNALPTPNINFTCASQTTFNEGQAVHIWFVDTTSAFIDLSADL